MLLSLLGLAVAAGAAGILFTDQLERTAAARSRVTGYESRIRALHGSHPPLAELAGRRDALRGEVAVLASRLYAPGELTPYSFGAEVKRRLAAHGLIVSRYQLVPLPGQAAVEFSASGHVAGLLTFLSDISRQARLWSIISLSIAVREGTDIADVVLRIGYGVGDGTSR
jgi:hypothetical protein